MCCRYYMEMSPELRPIVEEMNRSPLAGRMRDQLGRPLTAEGEVRPTDIVPAIASARDGSRAVFPMVFGFQPLPGASAPLINARVESAAEKPTFRESWKSHRCLLPASWYFEWEHLINPATLKVKSGDKYLIQARGSRWTWLAGLYRLEEARGIRYPAFVILTREAADSIRFIHDRMPVILSPEAAEEWIRPSADPEKLVRLACTDVVHSPCGGVPA